MSITPELPNNDRSESSQTLLQLRQTHTGTGIKSSLHGIIYQLNILMLVLRRGLKSGDQFRLATEMEEAGKFDDVVIIRKDKENNLIYHFLQAKHKQDDQDVITPKDLLNTKGGNFSLLKYFISYRENLLKTKEKYDREILPQDSTINESKLGDCILYTNAGLDTSTRAKRTLDFDTVLKSYKEPNFLFDSGEKDKSHKYRFDLETQKDKLKVIYDTLKQASKLDMLAEHMASKVCKEEQFSIQKDPFRTWHVALANEVFDVKNKKFKETFIKCNSQKTVVQNLHRLFKEKLRLKMPEKLNKFNTYWKKLEDGNIKLKLSDEKLPQFVQEPKLNSPKNTAQALCNSFDLKTNTITIADKPAESLNREELSKLAGHVIVKTDKTEKAPKKDFMTFYLSNAFKTGDDLCGNLNTFRDELIKKLKENCNLPENADMTDLLRDLKIEIKNFPAYEDLVDDVVTDKEMAEFLKHLIIAVNQPNELELYKIVEKEIGHDFRLLNSDLVASQFKKEMLDWFKAKQGRFLSEQDAESFFNDIRGMFNHDVLIGPTLEYKARVEASNIQFKTKFPITTMLSANKPVHCIVGKDKTWHSAIKLYSSLMSNNLFKGSDDSFIISTINTVIHLKPQFENAFSWTKNKTKPLVIEIDTVPEKGKLEDILQFLKDRILSKNDKKLWFILSEKDQLDSVVREYFKYEKITDSPTSFQDFHQTTQKHLLNKTIQIKYQGYSATSNQRIGDIYNENTMPTAMIKLLIDSEVEKTILSMTLPFESLSEFEQKCYIHRTFERSTVIKDGVLTSKDFKDILVIASDNKKFINEQIPKFISLKKDANEEENLSTQLSTFIESFEKLNDTKKQELPSERLILHCSNDETPDKLLAKLVTLCPKRNIHFLKRVLERNNENLYWERTYGKLDALKDYITDDFETFDENNFMPQHGIIAAEPGMGKTTVVNHMMAERLRQNTSTVLLKVDLHQHHKALNKRNFSSLEEGMQFFETALSLSLLARYYFQHLLENSSDEQPKLHFYFDGFDEISNEQQNALCKLLGHLRKTSARITVATRRHKTLQLENALCTLAYHLQSISKKRQKNYLTNFWKQSIDDSKETKIKKFANALIKKFSNAMKDEKNAFMGILLQLRLIAEAFEDKCRAFCNDTEATEPNINKKEFNRITLYQTLVHKKLQRFLHDKLSLGTRLSIGLQTSLKLQVCEAHKRLAFDNIFSDHSLSTRFFHSELFSTDEFNAIGLVEIRENDTKFVHRTFGEYLIATKLVTLLQHPYSKHSPELKQLLFSKLFLDSSEVILRFMKDLIHGSKDKKLKQQWKAVKKQRIQYRNDASGSPNKGSGSMNLYVKTASSDNEMDSNASLKEKIDTLNNMMSNNSNWDEVCIQINNLYTFVKKHEFFVEQLDQVLDVMMKAAKKYNGYPPVPKILSVIFIHLPEFSVKYIMKAYFPKPDGAMDPLDKLNTLAKIPIPATCQTTYSGAIIDTSEPRNYQQEFATKLDEISRLNRLLEENSAEGKKKKVNSVRKQLFEKKDLNLLRQLKSQFPNIKYEISEEDDQQVFTSVDPAALHYVCHSNNILTPDQLKCYMGKVNNKQCKVSSLYKKWHDTYEQLFLKIEPTTETLEDIRAFAVENTMASLLCRLKQNFSNTRDLSSKDCEGMFYREENNFSKVQNDFFWLETEGIKLLVTYKVFNRQLLHKLCEKIKESHINGYNTVYAEKIIENFIKPILREKSWSKFDRLAFLQCIQKFVHFYAKYDSKVDFDDNLFYNLFCLHRECFNDFTTDSTTLKFVANSLLFFVKETVNIKGDKPDSQKKGCMLFKIQTGLMMVDPADNFEKSIQLDNPDEVFEAIDCMFAKPEAAPNLDRCYKDMVKRFSGRYAVGKRKREVCSRENVLLMASDEATYSPFMRAVANGLLYEAREMIEKKRRITLCVGTTDNRVRNT